MKWIKTVKSGIEGSRIVSYKGFCEKDQSDRYYGGFSGDGMYAIEMFSEVNKEIIVDTLWVGRVVADGEIKKCICDSGDWPIEIDSDIWNKSVRWIKIS